MEAVWKQMQPVCFNILYWTAVCIRVQPKRLKIQTNATSGKQQWKKVKKMQQWRKAKQMQPVECNRVENATSVIIISTGGVAAEKSSSTTRTGSEPL